MGNRLKWLSALVAVGCLVGFVGCASTSTEDMDGVKPETIHQWYEVWYQEDRDTTTAIAQFRFGDQWGTTLRLSKGAKLLMNGEEITEVELLGARYTMNEKGAKPEYVFEFTTPDGKTYRNGIKLVPARFAADTPGALSKSKDVEISYEGPPAEEGETVSLLVYQTKGKGQQEIAESFTAEPGARGVKISGAQLKRFEDGPVTIRWLRRRSEDVREGTPRGGTIKAEYSSKGREVRIAP